MLSSYLYNICLLLNSSFNCADYKINSRFSSYVNFDLFENIKMKNKFYSQWRKLFDHVYSDFQFNYKYKILDQYNNLLKIKLIITKSFFSKQPPICSIDSSCINNYLLIIDSYDKSSLDTLMIISEEENSLLYNKYLSESLSLVSTSELNNFILNDTLLWKYKFENMISIYDKFLLSLSSESHLRTSNSKFNITNACFYAEKYALVPNSDYKNYDETGGDCTNFVSQIIHAGGINYNNLWHPYTTSWLRVEELYNHIIHTRLGYKLPDNAIFQKGSMIQFFTPKKGYFFHSGFITHVLPYNEAFYCCHSYNKLNYPLSEIYPVIYPGIRCIVFY